MRRSLRGRARSLGRYVDQLLGDHAGADVSVREALELFRDYTDELLHEVERQWTRDDDPAIRVKYMRVLRNGLLDREEKVDLHFSRSGQIHVPRALVSLVRRQFEVAGIGNVEPVLTVGPPRSYETFLPDLRKYLLAGLPKRTVAAGHSLALIHLPFVEGTRAEWQPVVVGHEVGHHIVTRKQSVERLNPDGWFTDDDIDRVERAGGVPDNVCWKTDTFWLGDLRHEEALKRVAANWVSEILCDINAVRLYGPSGIAAIGEALSSKKAPSPGSATHPPDWLRLCALFRIVRADGSFEPILAPLRPLASARRPAQGTPQRDTWDNVLSDIMLDKVAQLVDEVVGWGLDWYDTTARARSVASLSRVLALGVPGLSDLTRHSDARDVGSGKETGSAVRSEIPRDESSASVFGALIRDFDDVDGPVGRQRRPRRPGRPTRDQGHRHAGIREIMGGWPEARGG